MKISNLRLLAVALACSLPAVALADPITITAGLIVGGVGTFLNLSVLTIVAGTLAPVGAACARRRAREAACRS